jgi:hypothetical protein
MGQLSIEAWVYPSSFDLNCWNQTEAIVAKGDATEPYDLYELTMTRNENGGCGSVSSFDSFRAAFDIEANGDGIGVQSTVQHSPNQWYYIAGTYDGSVARIYVNGVLEATSAPHAPLVVTNTRPLFIENHTWASTSQQSLGRMGGTIDEIRISRVARSSDEIAEAATGTPQVAVPLNVAATAVSASQVSVTWSSVAAAASYQVYRRAAGQSFGLIASPQAASYTDNTVAGNTAYLYRVKAVDASNHASAPSAPDLATSMSFVDDPLSAGVTAKALHIAQLRTAVNAIRSLAGQSAYPFADTAAAGTTIRTVHITDLRAALSAALTALSLPAVTYTDSNLIAGMRIKAVHIQELRNATK